MHICFLTNEYPKEGFPHGGVGTFIATLAKELVKREVTVSVVGLNYISQEEIENIDGINVYRLVSKKMKGLQWFLNSRAIAKKIKSIHNGNPIDFVETTELGLAFIPKMKGIKYLIRMNGGHHFFAKAENRKIEWWKAFQEKKSFKKADYILAVSKYVGETTRNLLNLGNVPIQIIYNPVDINKFFNTSEAVYKPFTILFAGSIVEKKGVRQLIESLAFLVDDFPNIQLLIAGREGNLPGTKVPYLPILKKSITPKIVNHIKFLGAVPNDEMPKLIANANICCYPSHMEAMPLAWLEVLAMGKIFIGSITGPGNEAVINNKTGILANPFSPEDIADKIRWVFNHPEDSKAMGKNARNDVADRFDIAVIVNQNVDFFVKHKN